MRRAYASAIVYWRFSKRLICADMRAKALPVLKNSRNNGMLSKSIFLKDGQKTCPYKEKHGPLARQRYFLRGLPAAVSGFKRRRHWRHSRHNLAARLHKGAGPRHCRLLHGGPARGMRALLVLVPGHVSVERTWFKEPMKAEKNGFSLLCIWTDK